MGNFFPPTSACPFPLSWRPRIDFLFRVSFTLLTFLLSKSGDHCVFIFRESNSVALRNSFKTQLKVLLEHLPNVSGLAVKVKFILCHQDHFVIVPKFDI